MKKNILRQLLMLSKRVMYGFLIQLFFCTVLLANTGNAQRKTLEEVKISVNLTDKSLSQFFRLVEAKTDFRFTYTNKSVDLNQKVSIDALDQSLYNILEIISKQVFINFVQVNRNIHVKPTSSKTVPELEELGSIDFDVTGRVLDENGEPLPGATITIQGTTRGTVTDLDGNFMIDAPEGSVLVFSYIGYESKLVTLGGQSGLEVRLQPDSSSLEEVVVVGYGTQKRINLTGAVGVIEADQLENRTVASVEEALQGQVAGLTVVRTGGQPGNQSIDFKIRGTSTFTNNPVLTIVDGVPSSLDQINPNDIESISVLKDAASAAIYGSRATGGVILITTKSGKSGKARINYSGTISMQQPTRFPEKVSALDHALLFNEAMENDNPGATPFFTQNDIQLFSSPEWKDHDWDGYMLSNAMQTNQNLSISGGNEFHNYYFSLGYLKQDGTVINTGFERLNLRLNEGYKLSKKLQLNFNGAYSPSVRKAPGGGNLGNMLSFVAAQPQIDAIKSPDGSRWLQTTSGAGGGNPIALASEDGGESILNSNQLTGNFSLKYNFSPNLDLTGTYGMVSNQSRERDYRRKITLYDQNDPDQIILESPFNFLDIRHSSDIFQNLNLIANYQITIGDHNFSILGGVTREWFSQNNEVVGTRDFLTEDIYVISAGSTDPSFWNISGGASDWALSSFIARGNYSFKDRYLLEASMRYDGSSRFTEDLRWGFFPSMSAGWVLTQEQFLKDNPVFSFLKLRGSWGQVGNQNVGFYPFANTLSQSTYFFNGSPQRGVTTGGAPNPLLTWETKEAMNLGIEFSVLDNLLEVDFDVFQEKTRDILLLLPVPTTFGQPAPVQNAGRIDNKGWELALSHIKALGDFSYGLTLNLANATETVVDMGGVSPRFSGNTITEEGFPVNEWFGWRSIGLFQDIEDVENHSFQNPRTTPGDIKFEENGGDPNTITAADRVRLGRSDPRFPYGIRLSLNYKNFSFIAFGQGVMSHLVWSNGWTAHNFDRANSTLRTYHLDRWTPDNLNARFPKTRIGGGTAGGINNDFSSFWLEDASYFRIKQLELGYNLSTNLLSDLRISRARVFIGAENPFTFTRFLGYDPESPTGVGGRLIERRYPLSKLFSFGVNIEF
ncbi:SusC/RagA family TonB-linked outer membrane protein [Cyclobacterium xiamenense]|uniref:SusC/RagA family TonB-linked outer membrane protein n=1 Tax=Cyclobacterium xiamenense TaxID=1297121 RepID=UPI0035CE9576